VVLPAKMGQPPVGTVRRIGTDKLKVRARELAVEVAQEIYAKFGWAEPPVERLRVVQGQRFGAR
jgi:hypothetical protein